MAKKKTTKKKTAKATPKPKKKVTKSTSKKKVTKKKVTKKSTAKTTPKKKVTKKKAAKKAASKKPTSKKSTKKKTTKPAKATKTTTKKASGTTAAKSSNGKKKSPTKKPERIRYAKPPATALAYVPEEQAIPLSKTALKKADSGLTRKDKEALREMLLIKRQEILGDIESLRDGALGDDGDISHMPLHMADAGTDQYEQEANLGLMESERKTLEEIYEALKRFADGTYGVCLETGKPIGKGRLEYKPWAKYCIEVASQKEQQRRY